MTVWLNPSNEAMSLWPKDMLLMGKVIVIPIINQSMTYLSSIDLSPTYHQSIYHLPIINRSITFLSSIDLWPTYHQSIYDLPIINLSITYISSIDLFMTSRCRHHPPLQIHQRWTSWLAIASKSSRDLGGWCDRSPRMLGRNHRHSSSQRPESVQGIVVVVVVVAHVIYACTAACEIAARHDDVIADTQQSQYLHQHHTIYSTTISLHMAIYIERGVVLDHFQ